MSAHRLAASPGMFSPLPHGVKTVSSPKQGGREKKTAQLVNESPAQYVLLSQKVGRVKGALVILNMKFSLLVKKE